MDDLDKALLDLVQADFPLEPRPFAVLGEQLGVSEREALERVTRLKEEGVIRRLGASFHPRALGHVSTLVACVVPEDRLDDFARVVNAYAEVTHHYTRDHRYNVWFTLIAPSREDIRRILSEIRARTGISDLHSLEAEHVFKIDVHFDLRREARR
ncbi:MAG: Lrp/AsnC family transcriptional regulator [Armatimonadota bacterium]